MRGAKLVIALLAAGALVLGTGYAFAQQSPYTTTAPSTSMTPSATTPPPASATPSGSTTPEKAVTPKESKAMQPKQSREAKEEKGEKEVARDRVVRGSVTAVDITANPNTLVLQAQTGKEPTTIGVDVPPSAKITEGKAKKSLSDIKVGDRVMLRYDRTKDRLVAEQIRILPAGSQMSRAGKLKGSTQATPAASKSESPKQSY